MKEIATFLRFKQLLAHCMHNTISGPTFFADHDFLGDFYEQAAKQYDSVIERLIGSGETIDIIAIQTKAANLLNSVSTLNINNPQTCFAELLKVENELSSEIDQAAKSVSQGTMQLLGDIANEAQINIYKLKQRLKG